MAIQSLGIGSGILTSDLVDKLVNAERTPIENRLKSQRAAVDVKVSAYGTIKSALDKFQGATSALATPAAVKTNATSSSKDTVVTATASSLASPGTYSVEVTQMARAHTLTSKSYTSTTESIGTGTLSVKFGTTDYTLATDTYNSFTQNTAKGTYTITIDSGNNTLIGLRDTINNGNIGIRASIIDDGSGYRLSLASTETGAKNSLQITATDGDNDHTDASGVSAFTFNSSATQLTQSQAAQDSTFKVDGVSITRTNNLVTGVINGVTLNLKNTDVGNPVTINVLADVDAVSKRMQSMVDAYNEFRTTYNDLTKYDPKTKIGGPLVGDTVLGTLATQVRNTMSNAVTELQSGTIRALSDVGVSTNKTTGLLSFNSSTFSAKLASKPDEVTALLATRGTATDSLVNVIGSSSLSKAGTYSVNVTQLATQGVFNGSGVLPADFAANPVVVGTDNDTFKIKINGTESGTITLAQASYNTSAALVNEIQAKINADTTLKSASIALTVSYDSANNRLKFTSGRFGSASTVEFTSIDSTTATTLGMTQSAGTAGLDITGTLNGATATGTGQRLNIASGNDAAGLIVEVTGGSTGARGTVTFVRGVADKLNTSLSSMLASTGTIAKRNEGFSKELAEISKKTTDLDTRMTALKARLSKQFTTYDGIIKQLNSTSDYITQNFAVYNNSRK